jgi:hypothetical protein
MLKKIRISVDHSKNIALVGIKHQSINQSILTPQIKQQTIKENDGVIQWTFKTII